MENPKLDQAENLLMEAHDVILRLCAEIDQAYQTQFDGTPEIVKKIETYID